MKDLTSLAHSNPVWSLDAFADAANDWLPRSLPEARANSRVREEINPRVIRQYTTVGLVDPPLKEGREARYTYRHLIQVLVVRRLLADGLSMAVINPLIANQPNDALEAMLGGARLAYTAIEAASSSASNPALAFLDSLAAPAPAPAQKKMAAAPRPTPAPLPELKSESEENNYEDHYKEIDTEGWDEFDLASYFPPYAPPPESSAPPESARLAKVASSPSSPPPPAAASPALSASPPISPPPRRWARVEVVPGLELNILDGFRFPTAPHERQALLDLIAGALDANT